MRVTNSKDDSTGSSCMLGHLNKKYARLIRYRKPSCYLEITVLFHQKCWTNEVSNKTNKSTSSHIHEYKHPSILEKCGEYNKFLDVYVRSFKSFPYSNKMAYTVLFNRKK
jgi:hypothetical protein